jgi:hypothetical protein
MIMDYVEGFTIEHGSNCLSFEVGLASLLGQKRGKPTESVAKTMGGDIWMIGEFYLWLCRMKQVVGVDAMDDIDMMPSVSKCMAQAIDIHSVATETIRGVKGSKMQEIKWTSHFAILFLIRFPTCCLRVSKVSSSEWLFAGFYFFFT